jgi:large subunit ribosomal protein L34
MLTEKRYVLKSFAMKKGLKTPTIGRGKRAHGFRKRMKSHSGRLVLKRRRKKGRKKLTV